MSTLDLNQIGQHLTAMKTRHQDEHLRALAEHDPSGNAGKATAADIVCTVIIAGFLTLAFNAPAIYRFIAGALK